MPISRYHIGSGYGLADPELHRAAVKDDSDALLEAVAMSGLVGFLRQLGDLAQFAAELFHDLHEEVLATAARGHSLGSRVQQLEAEVPALEKAFLSQTHQSLFFSNGGIDWHPNLRSEQNLVTRGELPRFIMDSYEECRGPPRLFLLDKFDVAGAGACLKRYSDPSIFKAEPASSVTATVVHREKRIHKVRKKGARPRNGETPEVVTSHAKLHQLLLEERIENACSDPAHTVKLRKKQLNGSAVEAKTGKSYMEKILEMPSLDHKMVHETSIIPLGLKLMSDDYSETGIKKHGISSISPMKRSLGNEKTYSSPNEQKLELNPYSKLDRKTNGHLVKVHEQNSAGVTDKISSNQLKIPNETELVADEQKKRECSLDGFHFDDATSEVDDYMDALATMESELETDNDYRSKKSLFTVQRLTGSSDEEERQLQDQFSDSQSFGDSLTSEEISSFEHDRNEEHNEMQAQLSDSQSTDSASDDNTLFERDRNEAHTQLQTQFSDSQSIRNSSSDTENILSNQLPQIVELERTCGDFVTHYDANYQEEMIPNSRPVFSGSFLMDSERLLLPSDLGATSSASLPTRSQSGVTPPGPAELHLRLEDEDRKCLVEPMAAISDARSLVKDGACPVVSFDNNSLKNLYLCDSYVPSNALSQVSSDLNLTHEGECGDHSDIKVLQQESPNKYSSEILVGGDIDSQGEDPICLSMEVDLNSGSKPPHDDQDLKSDDYAIATQLKREDVFPVVETTLKSSFTEELCSDFIPRNQQDKPDSAEVLYPDQQSNFEEVSRIMPGDEISRSTSSLDPVEDGGLIKRPPSPDYTRQDSHVMVNDIFTIKVQSKDLAGPALPYIAENDASIFNCVASDSISSPSRNLSNMHELSLGSSDSHQMEMESYDTELTKISRELDAEKKENQLEPFSDMISSPMSYLSKLEESLSTFADPHEKDMEVNEAVARESLTELAAHKVDDQPEIAPTDIWLNLNTSVACDPSDSEICHDIQHSSIKEKIQYGSSINDMKMVTIYSKLGSHRSESSQNDLQNHKKSLSPPSYNQVKPETHLELFLKSEVGEQDMGFLLRNEENYTSEKFQPQQMQILNQLEQDRTASEFSHEVYPDEPSCDSSSKPSGQEINPTKHGMDQLKPLLPNLIPKATKINLEERPPMPPLPPMQWRMNKIPNTSLLSQREDIEVRQVSFQPIQPFKPDDKFQFGLSTSERETLLYQNPILPAMALESNKHQHSSGLSEGISEHPVAIPLQYPVMLNEANGQHNFLVLGRSQIQNPFLTLPVVSTGRPPNEFVIASEGERLLNSSPHPLILPAKCAVSGADPTFQQEKLPQTPSQLMEDTSSEVRKDRPGELHLVPPAECSVSGDDPISPKEKPTQSPNQLMEETSLESETLKQYSIDLEKKHGDPSVSPLSPPSVEMQPNHSLLASEGELVLSSDRPAQTSEFDRKLSYGKPKNKLPHPQSPLIDPVAALDKSRLRKVSERVRPQTPPKVDERDSLLEQIRTKSFNLRPAAVSRPSIQGPKTNLWVTAIVEKANSIRQAFAGSDEDDDVDSWSDS